MWSNEACHCASIHHQNIALVTLCTGQHIHLILGDNTTDEYAASRINAMLQAMWPKEHDNEPAQGDNYERTSCRSTVSQRNKLGTTDAGRAHTL